MRRNWWCVAVALTLAGCIRPTSAPYSTRVSGAGPLYRSEIAEQMERRSEIANAEDLVRYLRPSFIKSRGMQATDDEKVIVDSQLLGDLSWLSLIPARSVASLEYMSSSDACLHYGPHFTNGAIVITTSAE